MNLELLRKALKKSWSKDTCYPPMENEWSMDCPSFGQCYSTAMVLNDYLGGTILVGKFPEGTGHLWNLIDGEEVDLTRDQFDKFEIVSEPEERSRSYFDVRPKYFENNRRYLILKKRVEKYLSENK